MKKPTQPNKGESKARYEKGNKRPVRKLHLKDVTLVFNARGVTRLPRN